MGDRLDAFADYASSEYDREWQIKQAIEARCIALITADVALVTVVTLLAERLDLLKQLDESTIRNVGILSLVFYGLSAMTAMVTVVPGKYLSLSPDDLLAFLNELGGLTEDSARAEIIESRVAQLRQARETNEARARRLVVSYVLAVLATVAIAFAFAMSVHGAPAPS